MKQINTIAACDRPDSHFNGHQQAIPHKIYKFIVGIDNQNRQLLNQHVKKLDPNKNRVRLG